MPEFERGAQDPEDLDPEVPLSPLETKRKRGILVKKIKPQIGGKDGYRNKDFVPIEEISNTDVEGNEIGEDHIIDLIAVHEEQEDQKRKKIEREKALSEGRAYVIKKPGEEKEELEISLDKGTRNFETGGQLIDFLEKRDIARDRARQRYTEEQEKKAEAQKLSAKKNKKK